jgi:putative nucleotidyltransferase with HDIG domain
VISVHESGTFERDGGEVRLDWQVRDRILEIFAFVGAIETGPEEAPALMSFAFDRTPDTMAHARRVARYSLSVAREMCLRRELADAIEQAALFHDIGKLAIPESVLTKPARLTLGEMAVMRRHAMVGSEILRATRTLRRLAPMVVASHEWFGGGGYPLGLSGRSIPLGSRIIAVADAYDAMTHVSRRSRAPVSSDAGLAELLQNAPLQFDPYVCKAFISVLGRH